MRVGPSGLAPAPGERAQPRDELLDRERLDEIVVGAGLEARDAVGHRVARRQHQDRGGDPLRPQAAAHRQPVEAGHRDVEHDELGRLALGQRERCAASDGAAHTSKPSAARLRSSMRRTGGSSSTTSTRSGTISPRARRGAGRRATRPRARAPRRACTPTRRARSAPSRSARAAAPARSRTAC